MHWKRGIKRIRLVGLCSLLLGVVLIVSVLVTTLAGYAPDPGFQQLFSAFWPLGLMLIVLGLLLWLAIWVLAGFLPEADAKHSEPAAKTPFYR